MKLRASATELKSKLAPKSVKFSVLGGTEQGGKFTDSGLLTTRILLHVVEAWACYFTSLAFKSCICGAKQGDVMSFRSYIHGKCVINGGFIIIVRMRNNDNKVMYPEKGAYFQKASIALWKVKRLNFKGKDCISKAVGRNKSHLEVRLRKGSSFGGFI